MKGTRAPQTLEMLFTPPMMTAAAKPQTTMPLTHNGTPYWSLTIVEMALACTVEPMPKEARAAKRAKRIPSHLL